MESSMLNSPNEDVKVFLKLKKVDFSDDKPYYKISDKKQLFTLFDPVRKVHSDKSIDYDQFDKIFTDEENSYIYEEMCRNTVREALKGTSFCYIAYGLTHTGKKAILVGGEESVSNLNSRGLFFRLIENLINATKNTDLSINLSFLAVNKTKYSDLISNYMGKQFSDYDEKKVLETFRDTGSVDVSSVLKKLTVSVGDLNEIIHFYSKIISLFYKLEPLNERLYSRTHLLFFVTIVNNSGVTVSNLTFCILAGSEKFTPHSSDKKADRNSLKYKESIFIQSAFENLKNCMLLLKKPDSNNNNNTPNNNINDISFDESPLTYCMKNYIKSPSTKFRIIGCIQPNTGYYDSVKDTLMYLFNCKKTVSDRNNKLNQEKAPEEKRDEVLYELENKIKTQEKNMKKLNETISGLNKKTIESEVIYKKNLDVIKSAFNFEGDINKLTLNEESVKEAKYARSIRDSIDMVRLLKTKIGDLEKRIEDLKEENKKLLIEKRIIENDKAMVKLFTKYKEDNQHDENLRKISLTHSKEIETLKTEKEFLTRQVEAYRKEVEEKSKFIQKLPNVLQDNIDDKKELAMKKTGFVYEVELKCKKTLKKSQINHQKELEIASDTHEGIIYNKNQEIEKLRKENSVLKFNCQNDIKKYSEELFRVQKNIQYILGGYKKEFDFRKLTINVTSVNSFNYFLKAKENFDKIIENVTENFNRSSYPLLYSICDEKKNTNDKPNLNSGLNIPNASSDNFFRSSGIKEKIAPHTEKNYHSNNKNNINSPTAITRNIQNQINININMKNYQKKDLSLSASDMSEEMEKMKPKKIHNEENLVELERQELYEIVQDLQKKLGGFETFFEKVKREKRGYKNEGDTVKKSETENSFEIIKLFKENENLRSRLEEQVRINNSNKISMKSQERLIEKFNAQNIIGLGNKLSAQNFNKNLNRPETAFSQAVTTKSNPLLSPNTRTQSANSKSNYILRPQTGR